MSVTTKNWVLKTVEKLSASEMEELKRYLEYLVWKSQTPTGNIENPKDLSKLERRGQPKQILEAINKSHDVTTEDAAALLQSIKEGEIPMRLTPTFEETK